MNRFYLVLALFITAFTYSISLFAQEKVEISVSKNIELLFAMQMHSEMDNIVLSKGYSVFPLTTQLDFQLKKDYQNTFLKYKTNSQIAYFNTLIPKGFVFGAPFSTILMTDSLLNIRNNCWLQNLPFPQSTKDSVLLFIDKMKELRDLSQFDKFYQNNKLLYNTIIKQQEAKVSSRNLVHSIEEFFGWGLPAYHVVLVPMMWPGGISLEYKEQCHDSLSQVYVFIGPKHVKKGMPDFGTIDEYKSVLLHEFIHPFVMFYCNKHRSQIEKYSDLYMENLTVYQSNAIPDWFSAVNETLTRTIEIIINAGNNSEKAKQAIAYQSKELGFSYIPALYDSFEKYYSSDKRNIVSLDTVFQEILLTFDKLRKNE